MSTIRDFLVTQELAIQAGGGGASGGSGGGPAPERMIPAKGASLVGSEFNPPTGKGKDFAVEATGKKIDELDVEDMEAVHPPGCEKAVMGLKKKYGEDSSSVYKIAWSMKKAGKCG